MSFTFFSGDLPDMIRSSQLPLVVDFCSRRSTPSRRLFPVMDELSQEFKGRASVYIVDIEECPELAKLYGIRSIPTVLIIRNGEVTSASVGFREKSSYAKLLERL
ncbi:MAG: thioredoxin [Clostridia bacterium]|nr:thioredoxin [Clostridia bacterium]